MEHLPEVWHIPPGTPCIYVCIYVCMYVYIFACMELQLLLTLVGSGHQKPAFNLPVPSVQYKTPDDGHRRCSKHVEFYNRINLG